MIKTKGVLTGCFTNWCFTYGQARMIVLGHHSWALEGHENRILKTYIKSNFLFVCNHQLNPPKLGLPRA